MTVVIPQLFHVSNQNIAFVVAESLQSVLGLFVPSFIALHCEYSNTTFVFLPGVINNFRNVKPQAMEIKCFIISSVPFCQKCVLATFAKSNQVFFELVNQWWLRFFISHFWHFQKWFNVTPQFQTFAKMFDVFCHHQVVSHELCYLGTVHHKFFEMITFENGEFFVSFPNQQLKLIPKWCQNIVKLCLKVTWNMKAWIQSLLCVSSIFWWLQQKDERHQI